MFAVGKRLSIPGFGQSSIASGTRFVKDSRRSLNIKVSEGTGMVDMGSDEDAATEVDLGRVVNALPALVWTTQGDGRSDLRQPLLVRIHWSWTCTCALDHGWQRAIHPDDLTSFLDCWNVIQQSGRCQRDRRAIAALRRRISLVRVPSLSHAEDEAAVVRWCWLGLNADESAPLDGRLRRFFDMLPWQAGFLNAAGVSEFSNLQALNDFNMTQEELAQSRRSGIIHADDSREERPRCDGSTDDGRDARPANSHALPETAPIGGRAHGASPCVTHRATSSAM